MLHFNQMVWDRPHSNDYDSPILNDTAKNDTFLCRSTPFSCFFVVFFSKFCLLLVSDLDIEVFPYITTNFSVYLLLVLLSLLFISTTPAYILDKTLVLKTFQTLHNAFLNLVNNARRIKVKKKLIHTIIIIKLPPSI